MTYWILFAIFLYLLCAALLVAEVFIPSFGLLTVLAIGAAIWGVSIFFKLGNTAGWWGIAAAVVMIPAVLIFAYKILTKTGAGKNLFLAMPKKEPGEGIGDIEQLKGLLGKKAVVLTPLRPVGKCDFDGKKLECTAESGYVDKGKTVQVIKIEETQLTVREIN